VVFFFGKFWQYICAGKSLSSQKKAFGIRKVENQKEYAENYILSILMTFSLCNCFDRIMEVELGEMLRRFVKNKFRDTGI